MSYIYHKRKNMESYSDLVYKRIEETKVKLNILVEENYNNIINEEVVKLSQKLDRLLVKYIKIKERVSWNYLKYFKKNNDTIY